MAHLTGLWLIDAPASALNNLGQVEGGRTDNVVGVKYIRTRAGAFPYVSAQAFRYWLRTTLEQHVPAWRASPVSRELKIAYTDANPLLYWDDDLFGYMRAPSKRTDAKQAREAAAVEGQTPVETELTRISPFKVGTLVSIAPVTITEDFGVMARQEGDPVPHEHQFYRTTLKGLFALDFYSCGTFWHRHKTGYRNLDNVRKQRAEEMGLQPFDHGQAYRLPVEQRIARVAALVEGLSRLEGGAMQTLHYTPVAPSWFVMAVTEGGNNIFQHVVNADAKGLPLVDTAALSETLRVHADQLLSPVYLGWVRGYLDEQRDGVQAALEALDGNEDRPKVEAVLDHPRRVFERLIADLKEHPEWLD